MRSCGLVHFAYRSDREAAIRALLSDSARMAGIKSERDVDPEDDEHPPQVPAAVPEESHPGESQSNCASERSTQMFEDMMRTLKLYTADRIAMKLSIAHSIMEWMAEHSATLLTEYHEHAGGQTGYEQLHGTANRERTAGFGETCV